jgi:N-acetylmuramoyl-L-alanine amidase
MYLEQNSRRSKYGNVTPQRWRRQLVFRLLACFLFCLPVAAQDPAEVLRTVVIDPGHGGKDPGAPGRQSHEKNIVLDIALKLGKMIRQAYPEVNVVYTRKTDVFVDLSKRGDIANKAQANLFISIHANANKNKTPFGSETYVMGNSRTEENMEVAKRENSVILIEDDYSERYEGFDPNSPESYIYFSLLQNAYLNQSLNFAAEVQEQFKTTAGRVDRGVKQANFVVLWKTTMPSVLVEVGFISNAEEERYMNSREGKEQIATAIFNAFCAYKMKIDERNVSRSTVREIPEQDTPAAPQKTENQRQPPPAEKTAAGKVEFGVQIATSAKPVDTHPSNFKKHKNVERIQTSPKFYKYITGRTPDYAEAQNTLKNMSADFKDAFVVGIVNDKIVPAGDALNMLKQNTPQSNGAE